MFNEREFKNLINLRFFYSQEGNLAQVAVLDAQINDAIVAKRDAVSS
jgi:hypothetical protein